MDITGIKNYIIDNPDSIILLLESAGFEKIKERGDEIRCAKDSDSNPTSIRINKHTLFSVCYSTNVRGDIVTLIQNKLDMTFTQSLRWIVQTLGLSDKDFKQEKIILPFGGYYKKINKTSGDLVESRPIPPIVLKEYESPPNIRFYKDNIGFETQQKYKIGYDSYTKRITIPWFNTMGELIGIMGRLNKDNLEQDDLKYLPIIPFRKDNVLYGYDINYTNIVEKDMVIITEAEKGVMQLDTMNCPLGVGLGGNAITEHRANLIKGLGASKIIIAFDEGLDLETTLHAVKMLKTNNGFINNKIGYIYDPKGDVMPIGSKCSPTDLGVWKFKKLLKEYVIWN